MKYVIRWGGDKAFAPRYVSGGGSTSAQKEALKFDSRGHAVSFLGRESGEFPFDADWAEHGRIVRLRPKSKPAMIPEPVVGCDSDPDGFWVTINGVRVGTSYWTDVSAKCVANGIRKALGLPKSP